MNTKNSTLLKALNSKGLSEKDIEAFLSICKLKTVERKNVILERGAHQKKAFLILEGTVRGYILEKNGEEKNILLRSKGIFVGDAGLLFGNDLQRLCIESIDKTSFLIFSFEEFEKLANENKAMMTLYLNSLKEAVLRLTYRVESMITMTSEERYLNLLQKNPGFLKGSFDKHIANYLGITPVSLSRIKNQLKANKINK